MAERTLVIDPEKCIGCHTCEMVCSLKHQDGCSQTRARVRVITNGTQDFTMPIMCQHCERPLCQEVCPVGAIYRDMTTHAMLVDSEKCLGCKMCIYACPFGAPSLDPVDHVAILCDLCEGDPECAKLCPGEAIQFVRNDKIGVLKKRDGVKKLLNAVSEMLVGTERSD